MKQIKQFFTRLRRKPRRQEKRGSSMALVMIITSALVIWVICLAPLMATTGTTALKVQNGYTDYLASRSAIEYAKSELELIVRSEVPYTFAVIKQTSGTYTAIRKVNEDNFNNTLYNDYVTSPSPSDDKQDVPNMGNKGADVAAICAVTPPVVGGAEYKILITTYNNGVKALSFSVIYTLNGSLLIYPEAYKQTDALPINDFVLVDGILGGKYDANGNWVANTIWNSGITESNAENLGFTEALLPFLENPENGYADAREYAAVLKTTAYPAKYTAGSTEVLKDPIKDEPYTDEEWILPFGAYEDATVNTSAVGAVYLKEATNNAGRFYVYMCIGKNAEQNITSNVTALYANGTKYSKSGNNNYFTLPKNSGAYAVTADYSGTGAYDESATYNALARNGMTVYRYSGKASDYQSKITLSPNVSASFSGSTLTVTVNGVENGAKYYSTATNAWQDEKTFTIKNPSGVYYFYAYMPAQIGSDGKVKTSEVTYAGAVSTYKAVTPVNKGTYLLVNSSGVAMKSSSNESVSVEKISVAGSNPTSGGAIVINGNSDYSRLKWSVEKQDNSIDLYQYLSKNRYLTAKGSTNNGTTWSYSVSLATSKDTLTFDSSKNTLYQDITYDYTVGSGCDAEDKSATKRAYLNITDTDVSLTDSSTPAVYFVDASVLSTSAPAPTSITAPTDSFYSEYSEDITWESLYANGQKINGNSISSLAPGSYILTGKSTDGKFLTPYCVHIYKNASATNPVSALSINQDANDDSKITVTAETTSGNQLYIGYQERVYSSETNSWNAWADYSWFPIDGNTVTFYLPIGENYQYRFAALDVGDSTTAEARKESEEKSFPFADLTGNTFGRNDFMYYLNQDSSQDTGYYIIWYKMPTDEGVWPRKVHLQFKVNGKWQSSPGAEIAEYGITIDGSDYVIEYDAEGNVVKENVLVLSKPVGLTTENGYTSSMLTGASLYFMGGLNGGASIDTYNNAIYLTTDLLVLNGDMAMSGSTENGVLSAIYIYPYTANDIVDENRNTTNTKVLLFAASNVKNPNGDTIFVENYFYELPSGTNIFNLTSTKAESYIIGASDPNNAAAMDSVKALFKEKKYPEISFDIAFATKKQLSHLISSETWGWTVAGIMKNGESGDFNEGYAVCLYVNDTESGVITRNANRVLVAAAENSGRIFTVRNKMSFTTRYFSIDASVIQQDNSKASLTIYNLGQSANYISELFEFLGWDYSAYRSKTLQIDYERHTTLKLANGKESLILPQVCRYDDVADENGVQMGADLFTVNMENLLTPYTITEIEDLRENIDDVWGIADRALIKTVDRYIQISGEGSDGKLDLYANLGVEYEVYANYVYFDSSVKEISITRATSGIHVLSGEASHMKFNTQERGYDSIEYISFFKDPSVEAFTGTIIRVESPIKVTYTEKKSYANYNNGSGTLPAGYYYINANQYSDGVTLTEIVKNPTAFSIAESTLRDTAVEIDPDNSNAFIDSGLQGGTFGKAQGFSGGTVQ